MSKEIYYSDKYEDDKYEYRHVMLPKVGILLFRSFPFITPIMVRLLPSLCRRRTVCRSRSGETLGFSRALGGLFNLHAVCKVFLICYAGDFYLSINNVFKSLVYLRWVHYMLHEPEPHILLFRCQHMNPTQFVYFREKLFDIHENILICRRPLPNK